MKGFCKILCVGIITTMSVSAYAGTYNKEVKFGHTDVWNSDTVGISGTYYFGEVDDSLGPLAEATFLSPQSSIGVWTSRRKTEQQTNQTSNNVREGQGVFGTWHSGSGFYLGGGSNKQNTNRYPTTNNPTPSERDHEWTTGLAGYYLNDATDVWLGYREWKNTSTGSDYKSIRQSVGIKHLMALDDSHLALRAEWLDDVDNGTEDYTSLDTSATYYPAKDIGFKVGVINHHYKDDVARPGWDNTDLVKLFSTTQLRGFL